MLERLCVVVIAALLVAPAPAGLVILGVDRQVAVSAVAENPAANEFDFDAASDSLSISGAWTGSVYADAMISLAAATADASQRSDVSGEGIECAASAATGGYTEDPDATASGEAATTLEVAFVLDAPLRVRVRAAGPPTDGPSSTQPARFQLLRTGEVVYDYLAEVGAPAIDEFIVLPAGDYVYRIDCASSFELLAPGGGGGSAAIDASLVVAPACPGDANGDGVVDFVDLNHVLTDYGAVGPGLIGDLDGDGDCDFVDLNIVLANYGVIC